MLGRILSAVSVAALAGSVVYAQNVDAPAPAEGLTTPQAMAVTTTDDARAFGEAEFLLADANADGKLVKEEFTAFLTARLTPAGDDDATMGAAVKAHATHAPVAEGDIDAAGGGDAADATALAIAVEDAFVEIAGEKEAITEKMLVKARLAQFNEADADDDKTLDDAEKALFTALVLARTEA